MQGWFYLGKRKKVKGKRAWNRESGGVDLEKRSKVKG